jgi:para-nitrobenzyl esterase
MGITSALLALLAMTVGDHGPKATTAPVVNVAGETLKGERLPNTVEVYRGIPFAAPPTGELRWRAPQPPTARDGMIDATAFAPACPQDQGNPDWYRDVATHFGAAPDIIPELTNISEDCLYLNVWTARSDPAERAPVMVWIHGGSNVNGWAYEPNYLGHRLAEQGVVVVSINYRLGALGFLAHPNLNGLGAAEGATNAGLLDQMAALEWVRRNIGAFGGDPDRVTVFGESAGGGNIHALMRAPGAEGLFDRAIIQSGAVGAPAINPRADAEAAGMALMDALGAGTADEMRALPWRELVARRKEAIGDYYFAPVFDPAELPATSAPRPVPLLIGSNRDEWYMYLPPDTDTAWREAIDRHAAQGPERVADFLLVRTDDRKYAANLVMSAAEFLCPSVDIADANAAAGAPTYFYYFTREREGAEGLHAYHGAEIPYVFGTTDSWLPHDDTDEEISTAMMAYWVRFATTGDPNGGSLPDWPAYATDDPTFFELGDRMGLMQTDPSEICGLLDR